jgi:hypothetical protein
MGLRGKKLCIAELYGGLQAPPPHSSLVPTPTASSTTITKPIILNIIGGDSRIRYNKTHEVEK